jgi:hypothetical protein
MKKLSLASVLILLVIISCTKNSDTTNSSNTNNNVTCTGTKTFSADVSPIIQSVCAASGCHDASSSNGPGPLTNYQQVFNARTAIRAAVASGTMPKNSSLSANQKSAIICWIDNGATNN